MAVRRIARLPFGAIDARHGRDLVRRVESENREWAFSVVVLRNVEFAAEKRSLLSRFQCSTGSPDPPFNFEIAHRCEFSNSYFTSYEKSALSSTSATLNGLAD